MRGLSYISKSQAKQEVEAMENNLSATGHVVAEEAAIFFDASSNPPPLRDILIQVLYTYELRLKGMVN